MEWWFLVRVFFVFLSDFAILSAIELFSMQMFNIQVSNQNYRLSRLCLSTWSVIKVPS